MKHRTVQLTLVIEVNDDADGGWPMLNSVEPAGVNRQGHVDCALCRDEPPETEDFIKLCDACAVEEAINNLSIEDFLKANEIPYDKEGIITITGHMEWDVFDMFTGAEADETFDIVQWSFEPAAPMESVAPWQHSPTDSGS